MSTPPAFAPFQWPVRVYWEDTDAGGVVFYANYLRFFERARTEWLRALGVEQQHLRKTTGSMFVVAEASLRCLRPAQLDDELLITVEPAEAGRVSLIIAQQAFLKQAQGATALLCESRVRIGWVNAATLRPAKMPPILLNLLKR